MQNLETTHDTVFSFTGYEKSQEWVEKKRVGYTWFVPFFQRFYKLPDLINCLFLSY